MTDKELRDRIKGFETKLERMQDIEERLEKAFQNTERFRERMIQNGYSYRMLEEFNRAIYPITQHYNEIRNIRRRLQILKDEEARLEREHKEKVRKRQERLIEHVVKTATTSQFPYNTRCRNFSLTDGKTICEIKMDMVYCGNNCPYATNRVCSNKVDGKGMTVVYNKRNAVR